MSNRVRTGLASVVSGIYTMFQKSMVKIYRKGIPVWQSKSGKIRPVHGYRVHSGGGFNNLGAEADWWSSSVGGTGSWERALNKGYTSVSRSVYVRSYGFSVRCVRDLMIKIGIFAGIVTS